MNAIEYLWKLSQQLFIAGQTLFEEFQGMNPLLLLFGPTAGVIVAKILFAIRGA